MSTGDERVRWLIHAANERGGLAPWENRAALLGAFDDLVAALDGPIVAEPVPEPPAVDDDAPESRFMRLLEWRNSHPDGAVRSISDQDLGRLASSGAVSTGMIMETAMRLASQQVVVKVAGAISNVLRGRSAKAAPQEPAQPPPAPEPAPAPARPPAAAPEPTPAAPAPQADPFAPFQWEQVSQFAPFAWGEGPIPPSGGVIAELVGDEVRLSWTPVAGGGVTLYRVVESSSNWPTGAPEIGGLVGVTRRHSGSVRLHPTGAVTYLAVWANQGENLLAAQHAQPTLVGKAEIVWPPMDLSIQVTSDRSVAALLRARPGSRVEVQRFPKGATVNYDINREIDRAHVSDNGFRDLTPPMGEDIVYAAFSVAELADGSSRVSTPVTAEAHVVPAVEQVAVQVRGSTSVPGAYDISWIPPRHGRVVLFALPERPPVGLENEARTADIIEGQGLTSQYRINYPPTDLGGLMTITGYTVDPRWVRAHFVAVHWVSEDSVWVGPTVSMVKPKAPEYGQIVERVDAQIITFAWPEGVSVVQAYQGPRGHQLDPEDSEPIAQLTRDEYVRMGGMRITRTLPSNGCAIHLHGVVYLDGRPMYSQAATLDYPGITRLSYQVVPYGADGNPTQTGVRPASYRIYATVDDDLHETPLAVVAQVGRIPLHPQDGKTFGQPVVSLRSGIQTYLAEVPVGATTVFLRLFVAVAPAEAGSVAVLDPPVRTLEVVL